MEGKLDEERVTARSFLCFVCALCRVWAVPKANDEKAHTAAKSTYFIILILGLD
jgi:hypothetical protein